MMSRPRSLPVSWKSRAAFSSSVTTMRGRSTPFRLKSREVPVHRDLLGLLDLCVRLRRKGPLIPSLHRATAHCHLQGAFAKARKLGLIGHSRSCTNHTLRHSTARHWLACGVPLHVVSNWLGHSQLSSTIVYPELLPDPGDLIGLVT